MSEDERLSEYYSARCPECGWIGSSHNSVGGHGDDEGFCPDCWWRSGEEV